MQVNTYDPAAFIRYLPVYILGFALPQPSATIDRPVNNPSVITRAVVKWFAVKDMTPFKCYI